MEPASKKRNFGAAPSNYVAGLGRGAQGFTTRSDIGPARANETVNVPQRGEYIVGGRGRNVVSFGAAPAGYVAGRGRGVSGFGGPSESAPLPGQALVVTTAKPKGPDDEDESNFSDAKFDEFSGFSENLFSGAPYEDDDREADLIYDAIDRRMASKRKNHIALHSKEDANATKSNTSSIREQFADAKRELGKLSESDWENIPEPGDYSRQNKTVNKMTERFMPVPDSVLQTAAATVTTNATADPMLDSAGGATPYTDLMQIGGARKQVLGLNLDRVSDNVQGQSVVDPKGYLSGLGSIKVSSDAEVSDIQKARVLLRSVIQTNPKHAPGWIAIARLEEAAGKMVASRQWIEKGCETCPDNEDVWLEAARLNTPANAKAILAKSVRHLPQSVKIWLRAAELEQEVPAQKAVLRRSLELVPTSLKLWKALIQLEEPEDARVLLSRAVECVPAPDSLDLWLALARLESYENAQVVLNNARQAIPNNPVIWITAAKLEEANGHSDRVDRIIKKAVKAMEAQQVLIERDAWFREAEVAEKSRSIVTAQALIRSTLGLGIEEQDRRNTWLQDADAFIGRGCIECARTVYSQLLELFRGSQTLWIKAVQVEKEHGTRDSLDALLAQAVQACPQSDTLWLMGAKEKWLAGDVPGARAILKAANAAQPDSENIWLAAAKLEYENDEPDRARALLARARERAATERVWMKSVVLERELGHLPEACEQVNAAIERFPEFWKLYLLAAQLQKDKARDIYKQAIDKCPKRAEIWVNAAEHEMQTSGVAKARSILDAARIKLPTNPLVWLKTVQIERDSGNVKIAQTHLAKALQQCPDSGILWALAIDMEAKPQRKSKSYDALKKCNDDAHVFIAVANLFWADRKVEKARDWLNRAVTVNPDLGDAWAHFYRFELQYGVPEQQQALLARCEQADPRHGALWTQVSKSVGNARLKAKDILPKVAQLVSIPL